MAALRTRYKSTEYALLEQVANGTGFRANRWADAIALSLWPVRVLTSGVRHREAVEVLQSEAEVYERQLASVRRELEVLGSVQPAEEKANGEA